MNVSKAKNNISGNDEHRNSFSRNWKQGFVKSAIARGKWNDSKIDLTISICDGTELYIETQFPSIYFLKWLKIHFVTVSATNWVIIRPRHITCVYLATKKIEKLVINIADCSNLNVILYLSFWSIHYPLVQ